MHFHKLRIRISLLWLDVYKRQGRLMGIEPTNDGATIRCVNHFTTIAIAFLTFYQASYIIAYSLCFVNTFIEFFCRNVIMPFKE